MKRLRANTLKDHWDFFLHIGITGAITGAAFFALGFPPILTGLALAGTVGLQMGLGPAINRAMNKANAFAFKHHEQGSVVVNKPIADELEPEELRGVVAHEVGHIAAGHHIKRTISGFIASPAVLLTNLNQLVTTFSSIKNLGLVWAGQAIGKIAGDFIQERMGWSEEEPKQKAHITNTKQIFRNAATIGLAALFGAPDLILAVGLNYFTTKALSLNNKHYSRRKEFQADRIAGELTGEPEALSNGLYKVHDHHARGMTDYSPITPRDKPPGILTAVFERFEDMGKTHPNVHRRSEKLLSMNVPSLDIA